MGVLIRLWCKIQRIVFVLRYRPQFGRLGRHAYLAAPFRLDRPAGVSLGDRSVMARGGWLYCHNEQARIVIGEECELGLNNHIAAVGELRIGNYVLTASNVYIADNLHSYEDINEPIMQQPVRFKRAVSVGDGSWLGENVCIIGASVGRNCVIGANSVVTRDIPDYSVAVGAPARVIKQYDIAAGIWRTLPAVAEKG